MDLPDIKDPCSPRPSLLRIVVDNFEELIAALLLLAMMVVLGLQIIARYVFDDPVSWTEALAGTLFVWMSFLGSIGAIKRSEHVRVEIVTSNLRGVARKVTEMLTYGLTLLFFGLLLYHGVRIAESATYPILSLPLSWRYVYAAAPVFAALGTLRLTQIMVFKYNFRLVENWLPVHPPRS